MDTKSEQSPGPRRWQMLAILFTARFALGLQFQAAGAVTPFVLDAFGAGYAGLGTLVGLYLVPGILLTIPCGFLGQRFGEKSVVCAGLGLMCLGGILSGMASDYETLAVGRVLAGVGAIAQFVLLTKMLADWFTGSDIFLGMSLFILGWPVGIAAGGVLLPPLAAAHGWAMVFYLSSALCVIGLGMIALFYRAPQDLPVSAGTGLRPLTRAEFTLVTIAGIAWMLVNGGFMVLLSFGPPALDEQGVPFETAARVVSLMSWVPVVSLPLGGYLASRYGVPVIVMTVGLVGTIAANLAIPYVSAPYVAYLLYGFFITLATPIIGALPAQVLRPEVRGPGLGVFMVWNFVGMAIFPMIGGYLGEAYGSAEMAVLFAAAVMVAALATALTFFAARDRLQPPQDGPTTA